MARQLLRALRDVGTRDEAAAELLQCGFFEHACQLPFTEQVKELCRGDSEARSDTGRPGVPVPEKQVCRILDS